MNRSGQSGSTGSKESSTGKLPLLDQAVAAIRAEQVPAQEADGARRRVWERLQEAQTDTGVAARSGVASVDPGTRITGCGDVRALLGAYRAGTLSAPRELLVQMHLRDCVACREAHANRTLGRLRPWRERTAPVAAAARTSRPLLWLSLAGATLVMLGVGTWLFGDAFRPTPGGPRATLEESQGPVHLLAAGGQRAMTEGGSLLEREWVRTPRDSRATLRLRDGSRVEMRPHTEVGVSMNREDVKVHLERGSIIVHAAQRRRGHLIVSTEDARVVVTGTVFSVNRGTKGTRVSVLEGAVRVDWRGDQRILTAGQQLSTTRFINVIPIREEISWSGHADVQRQAALLGQPPPSGSTSTAATTPPSQTLGAEIRWPQLRYGSTLLSRLPASTLMFVAVPNYKDALDGAKALIDKQMKDNVVLNPWWKDRSASTAPAMGELFRRIRALSEHLGDEIVFGLSPSQHLQDHGKDDMRPVVLAEVKKPGLRALLERELAAMGAGDQIQLLDRAGLSGGTPAPAKPPEVVILVDDNLVVLARDRADVAQVLSGGGLAATAFGQRLGECYRDGAGLVFAADLGSIAPRAAAADGDPQKSQAVLRQLGASDARYLVVEQEHLGDSTQNRATVSFAGPRTGVASWLAAPAPMGALDFVTPSASFAAAFVVKQPSLVLDDLLRLIETLNPGMRLELAQLEARTGVQLRADLAATLGNDVVAAIDGPLLPLPSWKLVMEVHDPGRLALSLERLVTELNRVTSAAGRPGLVWQRQETARAVRSAAVTTSDTFILRATGTPFEARLLFVDGYLVVAPNEQMLHRSVRARQDGQVLRSSFRFRQLLPPDREANFSAVVYHNLGEAASAVGGWLGGSGALQPEQQQGLDRLVKDAKAGLFYVYGGSQEIQVASTGGFFGVTLDHVLGSAGLGDLLSRQRPGTTTGTTTGSTTR
jgi:hypothetical protein